MFIKINFTIYTAEKILLRLQIEEEEIDVTCSTHGTVKIKYKF
jgi:hypothetical protein